MSALHTPGNLCDDMSCLVCMNLDLNATIIANGGQAALDRINGEMQLIGGGKVASVKTYGKAPGTRSGRGIVRGMSAKQIKFATFLINSRDTSKLTLLKGWTLDIAKLNTISLAHARAFIDALLACPEKVTNNSVRMATQPQINYALNLLAKKETILTESDVKAATFKQISEYITTLKAAPYKKVESTTEEISEGMYTDGTKIIRAYMNRQGTRLLAKELIKEDDDYRFEYLGMANRFVKGMRRMTLEEAKAFGRMTETCCVCGTHLSDPDSQKDGIGPWCKKGFSK